MLDVIRFRGAVREVFFGEILSRPSAPSEGERGRRGVGGFVAPFLGSTPVRARLGRDCGRIHPTAPSGRTQPDDNATAQGTSRPEPPLTIAMRFSARGNRARWCGTSAARKFGLGRTSESTLEERLSTEPGRLSHSRPLWSLRLVLLRKFATAKKRIEKGRLFPCSVRFGELPALSAKHESGNLF